MGEVGDKLSSSTVNDLNAKFDDAKNQKNQKGNGVELVKALMSKIGGGGGGQDVDSQLENVEQIRQNAINIDPYVFVFYLFAIQVHQKADCVDVHFYRSKVASAEVQKIFVDVLRTRDSIFKSKSAF
jgi:hypothetical protein